jgi:ubiquinone/menaquinone biosynthesis C-methylase UbiE
MIDQRVINEYSDKYCLGLEAAYGHGMMSEGGSLAVEKLFQGIDPRNKRIVDIGSGIGGPALYLAQTYKARITGLEINPWMVEESTRRITPEHRELVDFLLITDNNLPFADASIDIVCSKGVFAHVQDKAPLFKEVFRVLKPGGLFLVNDWLSPIQGSWSENVKRMVELDGLTEIIMFAETDVRYAKLLTAAGFTRINATDQTAEYSTYNRAIVRNLSQLPATKTAELRATFGPSFIQNAIEGYSLIAQAQEDRELLVYKFMANKSS